MEAMRTVLAAEGIGFPETPRRALGGIIARRLWLRVRGLRFRTRQESEISPRELAGIDACWHAGIGLGLTDNVRGHVFQIQALLRSLRAGEPFRMARSLAVEAAYMSIPGPRARGRALAVWELARDQAAKVERPEAMGVVHLARGTIEFLCGHFRASLEACRVAEPVIREKCRGVPWESATVRLWAARSLLHLGKMQELAGYAPRAFRECGERGDLYGTTSLQSSVLPFVALAAGQPAAARAHADESLRRWTAPGFHVQHYFALFAGGSAFLYDGAPADGWQALEAKWGELERSLLLRVQIVRLNMFDRPAGRARRRHGFAQAHRCRPALGGAAAGRGVRLWQRPRPRAVGGCGPRARQPGRRGPAPPRGHQRLRRRAHGAPRRRRPRASGRARLR
jgi:hypothetical protein